MLRQLDIFDQPAPPLELESASPVNTKRMGGQNLRLFNYLLTGKSIHVFSQAKKDLRIGFLNSRCSDLINVHGIKIEKEYIKAKDIDGNDVDCVNYWMSEEEILRVKNQWG